MRTLKQLFDNNQAWAKAMAESDPQFFAEHADHQTPQYLWLGCSDSRVPENQITNLLPGEVFVHRNIANIIVHTDMSCLSVIQYAVEVLQINHVIVCGHYDCGGVHAAMQNKEYGLIDNWLRHLKDIYWRHNSALDTIADESKRFDRFCELNVIEQVSHVCHTTIVQGAWQRGQAVNVHGWIYNPRDGLLHDLKVTVTGPDEIDELYRIAMGDDKK